MHTKIPFSDFSNRSMVFLRFFNGIALSVINKSLLENTIPKYLHNISKRFERGASNGYFFGIPADYVGYAACFAGKGFVAVEANHRVVRGTCPYEQFDLPYDFQSSLFSLVLGTLEIEVVVVPSTSCSWWYSSIFFKLLLIIS